MTDAPILPGDAAIDLAQGTTVLVVDRAADTAAEWSDANDYELCENYGNARLNAHEGDTVFTCVYANSIRSEPSKTYDFPASRLARIEHEAAHGERLQRVIKMDLLADLFAAAIRSGVGGTFRSVCEVAGIGADLIRDASELADARVKSLDTGTSDSEDTADGELGDFNAGVEQ